MWVIGALAPEKASVVMLVGLVVWGCSMCVDLITCPSAPQSQMVGTRRSSAMLTAMTSSSGGCGGGLRLGGVLAPNENPACLLG